MPDSRRRLIDLSHTIEAGMITYKGLPAPLVCDHLSRESSRANYDPGTEFQIGRIEMVGNTGTYLDTPFHRYADGEDLSEVGLDRVAALPGLVVHVPDRQAIDADVFAGRDLRGKAVLVHTGWARHWRTDAYFEDHPFLTEAAAAFLVGAGAALVGIDSHNIDDTRTRSRPAHTQLLGAGIPICEHMRGLELLPDEGFRFTAAPPKLKAFGTFPVRAFAEIP
ncbi:MAG: cyclase family protein [Alphaproteobacteria bacterium]|uniref:cyclase family protein n=1 Tax=Brevundimonas sp. TaxID=1871086 RepID=UPI00179516AD|nr:cyclase family protein [Brevundimonas sp.]MBA3050625.1 cyclase family protein [Brevundimonas sp.]MBU3974384.1 cyclase family protein [Alphaproteobacteria bacterium]MBU4040189.1 cyclase family protein [Alphaproteobacteria bacterium]MBU4136622.1 cyclase family protein [Alphaproteobacteria bacterium]